MPSAGLIQGRRRTLRKATLLQVISFAAALAGGVAPAAADTTDELLARLRDKGILTQDEYDTLIQRRSAEKTTLAQATPTGSGTAASPADAIDPKSVVRMMDSGVGLQIGSVNLQISGSINAFYVHENADDASVANTVAGGVAAVASQKNTSSIRSGLLPSFLKFDITTNQAGWDVGAHFGLYPGINSVNPVVFNANSPGQPTALTTSGIDFRQNYLTLARPGFGELKAGRDIGLFGSEAILNDMTLLSVGTTGGNAAPSNTSLGRIGVGYIYTDFQPQITYTTPKFGGFQLAAGIFQPLTTIGDTEVNDTPGFQAEATYDLTAGDVTGRLWASFISQKHDSIGTLPKYTGSGFDVGGKLNFGPASLLGYYYNGSGLGTTGLFLLSTDANGRKRDSDGFYAQGTVTFDKLLLGVSYGESRLDLARGEPVSALVETNSSWVFQGRYALTPWASLVGEYTRTKSEAHNGNDASSNAIALGSIIFF